MNILHRKAIELKYHGHTYHQISQALGGRISESTLAKLFMMGGKLYLPYLQYVSKETEFNEEEVRKNFKESAKHAAVIMNSILQGALRKGDYKTALECLKEQMDRAGIVTVRKSQVNVKEEHEQPVTHDDYLSFLREHGIDPRNGHRLATPPLESN